MGYWWWVSLATFCGPAFHLGDILLNRRRWVVGAWLAFAEVDGHVAVIHGVGFWPFVVAVAHPLMEGIAVS